MKPTQEDTDQPRWVRGSAEIRADKQLIGPSASRALLPCRTPQP